MQQKQNLILKEDQIFRKIKRIAFEIYENNFEEAELIVAGIYDRGYLFAQMLVKELEAISPLKIKLVKVNLDKFSEVQGDVSLDILPEELASKCIILVDDVLNTGRTFAFALQPFLNIKVKKIQTAVLVNRGHTLFPISANYTGYELSTTLEEHIDVNLTGPEKGVFLF